MPFSFLFSFFLYKYPALARHPIYVHKAQNLPEYAHPGSLGWAIHHDIWEEE